MLNKEMQIRAIYSCAKPPRINNTRTRTAQQMGIIYCADFYIFSANTELIWF